MPVRIRQIHRPSRSHFQAKEIRQRADVVAALLALPYLDTEQAAFVAQTSPSTIRRAPDHMPSKQ